MDKLKRIAALEKIDKRKELRERVANMGYSDLIYILAYLHEDVIRNMIMKCDLKEVEYAIEHKAMEL